MNHIETFDISKNKGCFITGEAGTGKSTKCKELQKQIGENKYVVCTPTQKSSLLKNAVTIYNLFNINPKDNTYVRGTVEKLKKSGVEWVFIDEVSMVNSRVWGILNDIKKKYNFKFILIGDFNGDMWSARAAAQRAEPSWTTQSSPRRPPRPCSSSPRRSNCSANGRA